MADILFPYPTLRHPLGVTVGAVLLDGYPASIPATRDDRVLHLFEDKRPWRRAELPVTVSADRQALQAFEAEHGRTLVTVVAHCRPTNARQTFRPGRDEADGASWSGVLELDRDNFRDRVELRTVMTAAPAGVSDRPVASGDVWTLHFDEPASLRLRGTLDVKWVDFRTSDHPLTKQFPDSTHVLHLDGALPEVWLNSSFPGLEALLKDRKDRHGAEKGLHDLMRTGVARGVWLALFADAMAAVVRPDADGGEPEWPLEWRAEVLRTVLTKVDPSKTERELIELAAGDWSRSPGSATLLPRAEAIVGDIIKANETLRRFAQTYQEGGDQ